MGEQKRIVVKPLKREEPDLRKLARAVIELAIELQDLEGADGADDQPEEAA